MTHDINDLKLNSLQPLQIILDTTSTSNVIYIGRALPGVTANDATWKIAKLNTASGFDLKWADSGQFSQVWANRTSLTYV